MSTNTLNEKDFEALLAAYVARFVQRVRPFAVQVADGTYRWRYDEVTPALLLAHLRGEVTLALSSSDGQGLTQWLCLDVDEAAPDALPRLLTVRRALADMDLPGLVEASRRGGHLWLFLERPMLVATARAGILSALALLHTRDIQMPTYELYPDAGARAPGSLGHAVRLPLGIHQLTGKRYPLFDDAGWPSAFTSSEAALRFVVAWPHMEMSALLDLAARRGSSRNGWHADTSENDAARGTDDKLPGKGSPTLLGDPDGPHERADTESKVGTRSSVIRWVDAHVSPLDLLAQLATDSEMKRVGRGYLGWCPFHDDRASDEQGRPGTPSFYLVQDRRYGWSWRCLSTNCEQHDGPMQHSFRLFQELTGLTAASAVREAIDWWPESGRARPLHPEDMDEIGDVHDTHERSTSDAAQDSSPR